MKCAIISVTKNTISTGRDLENMHYFSSSASATGHDEPWTLLRLLAIRKIYIAEGIAKNTFV
jgi:hypothetical protein